MASRFAITGLRLVCLSIKTDPTGTGPRSVVQQLRAHGSELQLNPQHIQFRKICYWDYHDLVWHEKLMIGTILIELIYTFVTLHWLLLFYLDFSIAHHLRRVFTRQQGKEK